MDKNTDAIDNRKIEQDSLPQIAVGEYPAFLNVERGIATCDNDEEFYQEMLATYVEGDKRQMLIEAFNLEDFENYRRLVHSVKSTSLMIGAEELSAYAKRIEDSLLSGNSEYAKQEYHTFMQSYDEIIEALRIYVDDVHL